MVDVRLAQQERRGRRDHQARGLGQYRRVSAHVGSIHTKRPVRLGPHEGLHGLTAYGVARRTREIGVRIALGAPRGSVLWLVVRQGLLLAVIGAVAGAAGAFALGRTLSSLLFGVSAADVPAFGIALAVALVTAVVACLLPAHRAASLDPLQGLRAE